MKYNLVELIIDSMFFKDIRTHNVKSIEMTVQYNIRFVLSKQKAIYLPFSRCFS